jgi:CHAT domain/Peptidase family C25
VLPIVPAPAARDEPAVTPASEADAATPTVRDVVVQVTLIKGGITNVRAPVAVAGRYDGLPLSGATKAFDRLLDSWLTRAIDLGMIGSGLGQVFPVNLQARQQAGKMNVGCLLLAGMGEPGRFAQDDLRFLMSNVTVAVKGLGYDQFVTSLLGTRRNEIPIGKAIRGVLEGITDGYERFRAIANALTEDRERFRSAGQRPLYLVLVDSDATALQRMQKALEAIAREHALKDLKLDVVRADDVSDDATGESSTADAEEEGPVTLLHVTGREPDPTNAGTGAGETKTFRFSAMSESAAVPIRDEEINAYLIRQLPDRMTKASPLEKREAYGTFLANLLIPEDFRRLIEGAGNLTLELDDSTAVYPWEMLAYQKYSKASFLGTSVSISRQFRTTLSPPPSSPPALNNRFNVLIIADPWLDRPLPQARQEAVEVVDILQRARCAWHGAYEFTATVRIGSQGDANLEPILEGLRSRGWLKSVEPCDPLELAMLIVNNVYDVIHYAGHAFFDKKAKRAGWMFGPDCILTANEIFRVRQVPRLVFANACFSATTDHAEQRGQLVGLAQAFFARGIPNFIGAGWQVDDSCACECARWFYARVLGLRSPDDADCITDGPSTIGDALVEARGKVLDLNEESSSWGAYQHYGRTGDRLLAPLNPAVRLDPTVAPAAKEASAASGTIFSVPSVSGGTPVSMNVEAEATTTKPADPNLIYVNGIDLETGQYAFAPRSIDALAKQVLIRPGVGAFEAVHAETPRSFGVPFGMDPSKLEEAGWGIVFHEDTPQDVRGALEPLIKLRGGQAGVRCKVLDYKKGEQTRDWYQRHHISAGNIDPEVIPYHLLLIGPPDLIPFDFQYLLGIEYAVGRLAFDSHAEYERYARSIVAYESASAAPNAKEIAYWGTRHLGDPATNLSASLLIDPLANGVPGAAGALKRPIHADVGYGQKLHLGDDATKDALLASLHAAKPPAMLFTASHGMAVRSGRPDQLPNQGALLCQDWPGFGGVRAEHFLAAADIADDANVNGMVALVFACFGNGTPDVDQFPMDLSQSGKSPPLAPQPFIASLPRRLLAHPNGSALAIIGHIDRAWGFSIQAAKVPDAQIGTFRNGIGFILDGAPVGHAMCGQFGARFAALSTALASATSPVAPAAMRLKDRDLVTYWLERNDAQNYVLLGDPAVRIRKDALA